MNSFLDIFFTSQFEKSINSQMLDYDFVFPKKQVQEYVENLCSIPVENYLDYIENFSKVCSLSSRDIFQFSNVDDATKKMCKIVKENNDPGLKHLDIGKLLLNDGKVRNNVAYTKYGENHAKFAENLGVMHSLDSVFFLSCIGQILDELDEKEYDILLIRLFLRLRLVQKLYLESINGMVDLRNCLSVLSDSTYLRRASNVKTVLKILRKSNEYNFQNFFDKISW